MAQGPEQNQDMARFLARLPPSLAASFDAEQLAAVALHFGMRHRTRHAIDWRWQVRLPFLRGYFVVLAGSDRAGD